MERKGLSMLEDKSWPPSILYLLLLLKDMGFRITKKEIADEENDFPLEIYWTDNLNHVYHTYTLNTKKTDKKRFLELFGGGTRGFSNVVGAKPWSSTVAPTTSEVEANFYADLGNGLNNKIYFDKGWIAYTGEGYSNMALLQIDTCEQPAGKGFTITYGELAFENYMILKPDWCPDSINNWEI